MTPEVKAIKDAYEAYKAEVQEDLAALAGKISQLQDLLNAAQTPDPDAIALAKEIADDTATMHATQHPEPAPAPEPTPAS